LRKLRAIGADVILIDPQYAPKVVAKTEAMVGVITISAKQGLFEHYAAMRHWRKVNGVPLGAFLSSDGLHMNDWSYGCIAKLLAAAMPRPPHAWR